MTLFLHSGKSFMIVVASLILILSLNEADSRLYQIPRDEMELRVSLMLQ